jgi:transketolase
VYVQQGIHAERLHEQSDNLTSRTLNLPTDRLPRHPSQTELDELCINTLRCLGMDGVQNATSGHPGMVMGMAPAAYLLWTRHLRHAPRHPEWVNRDRFVLSAGHGSMLLYSLLHLTGYDLPLDELRRFRQLDSRTPGHPEYGVTPGVEVTTGPLGQGLSNAVGMAIAARYLGAYFNRPGHAVFDYRVYVIAGDGCMQEGVAAEASSFAGHLGLGNLIVLYDDNRITIDGATSLSFSEDVTRRYEAYGWHVQRVDGDGNDLEAMDRALRRAQAELHRPSLISIRTHIAFGSPNKQDTAEAHGSPLGEDEVALTKQRLGFDPAQRFVIPDAALQHYRAAAETGEARRDEWNTLWEGYTSAYPDLAEMFGQWSRRVPSTWERFWRDHVPRFDPAKPLATREAQGRILDALMPDMPNVLGGSADLTPSNNTRFRGAVDVSRATPEGRYIRFGVREHAMGAILNGIAVSGVLIPYGGTFFTFADYMRASVRLAALSHYPTIFVFTHDSIGLGEDGPTHQPVEQLPSLRAMPGLVTIRPADANETAYAWKFALECTSGPVALLLTRQKVPVLDQTRYSSAAQLARGAYVLADSPGARVLLLASGSEVHIALTARALLEKEGIPARVVSMPSWELFERQPEEYRQEVLPPSVRSRVAVEAAVGFGWERYVGQSGTVVAMNGFGKSAPVDALYTAFGITPEAVVSAARRVLL